MSAATGAPTPGSQPRRGFLAWLAMVWEGIAIAFDAIRANKIRAGLTILGVGIGVSVVVTIAALITGIRSSISESLEASGPDNLIVMRFNPTAIRIQVGNNRPPWWGRPVLEPDEAARIERLPSVSEALSSAFFLAGRSVPKTVSMISWMRSWQLPQPPPALT